MKSVSSRNNYKRNNIYKNKNIYSRKNKKIKILRESSIFKSKKRKFKKNIKNIELLVEKI